MVGDTGRADEGDAKGSAKHGFEDVAHARAFLAFVVFAILVFTESHLLLGTRCRVEGDDMATLLVLNDAKVRARRRGSAGSRQGTRKPMARV